MFYSSVKNGFYPVELHASYFLERTRTDNDGVVVDRWFEPDPDGPIYDAVEISDTEYQQLLNGQSAGKIIKPDSSGVPVLIDPPAAPIDKRRNTAKSAIDITAGSARARYVSAGQLIEEEYRLALQQTQQWRSAGSPAESVPQAIQDCPLCHPSCPVGGFA